MAGLVAAVANANFLLRVVVGSRLDPGSSEISELSVPGQPWAWVFRVGDTTAGLAGILLAVGVGAVSVRGRRRREHGWTLRVLAAGLLAFGVGTVISALVTLDCPSRAGAHCHIQNDFQTVVHDLVSTVATLGLVFGAMALTIVRSARLGRWQRGAELVLVVAVTALAVWQGVAALEQDTRGQGTIQRGQVAASSVWLGLVGVLLQRRFAIPRRSERDSSALLGRDAERLDGRASRSGGPGQPRAAEDAEPRRVRRVLRRGRAPSGPAPGGRSRAAGGTAA